MHRRCWVRIEMAGPADTLFDHFVHTREQKTAFSNLGLSTVDQVLRHVPRTYLFPGELTPMEELEPDTTAVVLGKVLSVDLIRLRDRKRSLTKVKLRGRYTAVDLTFFNMPWLEKNLALGQNIAVSGKVVDTQYGRQINQPRILDSNFDLDDGEWGRGSVSMHQEMQMTKPMPIYSVKGKSKLSTVTRVIHRMLDRLPMEAFADTMPQHVRNEMGLYSYKEALEGIHRPRDKAQLQQARDWFAFEEAFALQTYMLSNKQVHEKEAAPTLAGAAMGKLDQFDQNQTFELTRSQKQAGTEISRDLVRSTPMNRLLHGDVGSGKTLVALRAMLQAVDSGYQAALLAPTEILATQHVGSLRSLLGELASDGFTDGVRIELLTGSMSGRERKRVATELAAGIVDIVVGTHTLLSDTTIFDKLGIVVIDEQHRFGVEQREQLREKGGGKVPHTLVMTATPIPRTVALTVYSDLDVSTLRELPGGPKQVRTHVVPMYEKPLWFNRVWEVVSEQVQHGHQAFVVTSRIDSEEDPDAANDGTQGGGAGETGGPDPGRPRLLGVEELADKLRSHPELKDVRIETLHGKSEQDVKETAMQRFKDHEFDVLVATTVIEVGVDVHNARVMVVFDADRFGVAQLHQLRGRVGRDGKPAMCFFVTQNREDSESRERLEYVASTTDGFALAEYDLKTRKEGDVLGTSQWGAARLRFVSIKDENLIMTARNAAQDALADDPKLAQRPALALYLTDIMQIEA